MNNNELQNFLETLHLEYDDFEDECRQLTGKEMLDSITEKYTKFKIYDYLLANAKYYNYKHLKKNNILNYYYNQFIKTS